jgi:hypothetical protein
MQSNQNSKQSFFILILVLFILLIIVLVDNSVTIVGSVGPIGYTNSSVYIPYIGAPFASIHP